jgi:CrcB protein
VREIDRREIAAVFVGGFVGAIARLGLIEAFPHGALEWPWPTFLANVLGAFALGWLTTRLQERLPISAYRRPLLGTGFCGALTTFSTMQLELVRMLEGGSLALAAGYVLLSVSAGFGAVVLATGLARRTRFAG